MHNAVEILKERGLLEAVTHPEAAARLACEPAVVYAGFDPSSSSLQVGNLATCMALAHMQRCGHRVIALVGGATGLIGDPSGKTSARAMLDADRIRANAVGIEENLSRLLDFAHPTAPAKLVDNYDWFADFTFVSFLRDVGRHFRLGAMLAKENVRTRLNSEGGLSFAEFSYPLLQAYDFLKLHETEGCTVQMGGSDQWGNITAGIELIRRVKGAEVCGLTLPLVCDSAGRKLGKSEGNAVYLDARKTSVYDFYQYFVRAEDADVARLLRVFTFLPLSEIAELEQRVRAAPERREAQKRLAEEVTRLVHGEAGLRQARQASEALFGGALEGLSADELLVIFADADLAPLERDQVEGQRVADVAARSGLCRSRGEARRLIQSGGLYMNNKRVADVEDRAGTDSLLDGRLLALRSGKRRYVLVRID